MARVEVDAGYTPNSVSPDSVASNSGASNSGAADGTAEPATHGGETSAEGEFSFLVPAAEAHEEVTQVYNGDSHLVEDAPATLRAESDAVAVYVQNDLASRVTDDQLNGFLTRLVATGSPESYLPNSGILPTNESVFGGLKVGNLPDGKQRVFVVDTAGAGDGYLCGWCSYPDLHLDAALVSPLDGEHALSISAHELYHSIHRGYDADEEVWMDESLAEAAMTVNGYFTDQAWLSDFLGNPNQDWGPDGADVTRVHYGACLAWGTFLWEQGGPALMQAVTKEPANGWSGLDAALAEIGETRSGWDLFLELGAALYFDDPERGFGVRAFDFPTNLHVARLDGDVTDTLEPYGFLHYEVTADSRITVEGNDVTPVYVQDDAKLTLQNVSPGVSFDASGPGVLIVTGRTRTPVTVRID